VWSGTQTDVESVEWRCWNDARAGVGEQPVWADGVLFWSDLVGPSLSCANVDGTLRTWTLPDMMGSYALLPDGRGAVVALGSGIHRLDLDTGSLELLHAAPYDPAGYRFNDGRCDPRGRFWVGTNRQPGSGRPRGSAAFYRLDETGLHQQFDGVSIANGIAFSPDGATMYLADTSGHRILACAYDLATGEAGERRVHVQLDESHAPDGASVDRDGGYWVALYGAGLIIRVTPDGEIGRVLRAPVTHPTMVSFGGEDLSTMFVTSGRAYADADVLAREPLAGGVFAAEVGARGLPEPRFDPTMSVPVG
jgi:sugar lactone lactonase YvrE